ncbi:MAG: protein kinase [Nannocystaceae bacterium]|nr:protein kinase [Nannocystaceae bacterium]
MDDHTTRQEGVGALALDERQSLARLEARMFGRADSTVRVDRYELGQPLGRGGMGVVYEGWDPELRRKVAIKLVNVADVGSRGAARLLREARSIARISHPNVVPVYDVGDFAGGPAAAGDERNVFVVMELVEGEDLERWLAAGSRSWTEVLDVFLAAGRGLAAAHAAGVLHRDFKPANVLLGRDGRVRVADFGLARGIDRSVAQPEEPAAPDARSGATTSDVHTQTGVVMGTPYYMAPEQMRGVEADQASDQYAFCVALYSGLFGQGPFPRLGVQALADAKGRGAVLQPPEHANVPQWLTELLWRGLDPDPARRFPSVQALLQAIEHRRGRRRRRVRATLAVGAVAAALASGLAMGKLDGDEAAGGVELVPLPPAVVVTGPPVLAFEPFEVPPDESVAWAGDGLPNLMDEELAGREGLRAIPYFRFKTALSTVAAARHDSIAEAFGATAVVRGHLTAREQGYALTIELRALDGTVQLSRTVTAERNRLAEAGRELAREIGAHVLGHPVEQQDDGRATTYEANLALGVAALERHDLAVALGYLDEARRLQPDGVDAHFYGGIVAGWLGMEDEVRSELALAAKGDLAAPKRRYVDAYLLEMKQGHAGAREAFAAAAAEYPDDPYLAYGQFECEYHSGNGDAAVAAFRRLHGLSPTFGTGLSHVLERSAAIGDGATIEWGIGVAEGAGLKPAFVAYWRARRRALGGDYRGALELLAPFVKEDGYVEDQTLGWYTVSGEQALAMSLVRQRAERDARLLGVPELALCVLAGDHGCERRAFDRERQGIDAVPHSQSSTIAWVGLAVLQTIVGDRERLHELGRMASAAIEPALEPDIRVVMAKTLVAAAQGEAAAVTTAASSPFAEVRAVAAALQAETAGDLAGAAAKWQAALALAVEPRFVFAERVALARVHRAARDHTGVLEACSGVTKPQVFDWSWTAAIAPCLVWSGESARALGDATAAAAHFERVLALREAAGDDDPWTTAAREGLAAVRPRPGG